MTSSARSCVAIHSFALAELTGAQAPGDRLRSSFASLGSPNYLFPGIPSLFLSRSRSRWRCDGGPTRIIESRATATVHDPTVRARPSLPGFVPARKGGWDTRVCFYAREKLIYQFPLLSAPFSALISLPFSLSRARARARASAFRYNLFLPEI